MKRFLSLFVAAVLSVAFTSVSADTFPTKPIRLVVPFPPAGASDILGRIIGQKLAEVLAQQVIVDNRPGAGGNIGSDMVAKSPPDGYTLILASVGTHAINSSLYPKMPYDPVKNFAPVSLFATVPTVLVVNPNVPAKNLRELLALAHEQPGKLNFASAGTGTTQHLAGELLKIVAKIDIVHVPYKGGGPAVTDLIAGQVSLMFPNIPPVHSHIRSGRLRAIAVASPRRSPALPDVPTVAEAGGFDSFDVSTWFGILAAAGTTRDVVAKLNAAMNTVLEFPDTRAKLVEQGAEPLTSTPEQFGDFIKAEMTRWAAIVKQAGAKLE